MMRVRLTFAKGGPLRYVGHLDLHKTLERTFRRAALPLAYTQGFSPHPRLNLAAALPLGFTSEGEIADVWLERDLPLDHIREALEDALPPGLNLYHVESIPLEQPALQSQVYAGDYEVTLLEPLPDLKAKVAALSQSKTLPRRRRQKEYDLRPLILALQTLPPDSQGNPRLFMRLSLREGATGRPEEVIEALGGDPLAARIHRLRLHLGTPQPTE